MTDCAFVRGISLNPLLLRSHRIPPLALAGHTLARGLLGLALHNMLRVDMRCA
jgi:hypothetical protein